MYRIRSASGNEVSYNSLEEFSAAVRRGEVHPEDEIFHTRANRWLDVKSHPHYRSATTWANHEPAAAATAPRAPVAPAQPVRHGQAAATAPNNTVSKAQVFERPVIKTAPQTTVRPQLQAAPAAPTAPVETVPPAAPKTEARVGPAPKSKELAFLDLGDAAAKAKAAPVEPEPAAPAPLPKLELRHLPKVEPKAPIQAAAPAPAPAPAPPAPAPQAKKPEAVSGPGSEVEFLVMDNGIESPARTSSGYKTVPEDLNLLFDAPLPEKPASSAEGHVSAGAAPKSLRSGKNPAMPAELPALDSHAQSSKAEIELDIPSGAMLESSTPSTPHPQAPEQPKGKSNAMLFGGGLAIIAVAGTLLAWRPWKGAGSVSEVSAQPQPTAPVQQSTPAPAPSNGTALVGAPAPTPIRSTSTTTTTAAATTKPGAKPGETPPANTDSAADDQVIAVAQPTFKAADVNLGAVDLNLNGNKSSGAVASPTELVRRLIDAERKAQQELNSKLAAAGFRNVLAADHLGSTSGVGSARSAWGAGAEAIRSYRGRIARLESAYEDSVLSSQRAQKWSGDEMRAWASRQSLAEPAESSQLADLMFSQVNEGLEILAALSGEYTVKGQNINFKNATSATRYTSIRGWVEQRTSSWTSIPETARPYSVTAILHALGDGFPAAQ